MSRWNEYLEHQRDHRREQREISRRLKDDNFKLI